VRRLISRCRPAGVHRALRHGSAGFCQGGLRQLVREGRLVRVGQGLYARARPSMTSGEAVPIGGLSALKEALHRVAQNRTGDGPWRHGSGANGCAVSIQESAVRRSRARRTMRSNTGCGSPGDAAITFSTSLAAA
jgi:hypothetical protein